MKKSTKIITTAVALVLVVAAMVVGIYAATAGSAAITASVSWEATAGLEFELKAWTYYSAEHYNGTSFPSSSSHRIDTIIVDTTTTNTQATGMSKTLNASFIDTTDDGVNNPKELYYFYEIWNPGQKGLNISLTKYPVSTENIKVEYGFGGSNYTIFTYGIHMGNLDNDFSTTPITEQIISSGAQPCTFGFRLTILTPDVSISNFDASVAFSFS